MAGFPSLAQFAPDIIVRYVSETNRVDVRLQFNQEPTYKRLREQLLSGEVDLIFATEVDDPRVGRTYIGEHPVVVLVPQDHRLARYDTVDLKELDGEDFIAFDPNCQLRGETDQIFGELGIHVNITTETAQDLIMSGLVASNHGVHHPALSPGRRPLPHQDRLHLQLPAPQEAVPVLEQGAVPAPGGRVFPGLRGAQRRRVQPIPGQAPAGAAVRGRSGLPMSKIAR